MHCEGSQYSRTGTHQLPVSDPAAAASLVSKLVRETPDSNYVLPRMSLALDHFNLMAPELFF